MTYSYYIRTSKNNKVDWDSLTEKEQEQIGQMIRSEEHTSELQSQR